MPVVPRPTAAPHRRTRQRRVALPFASSFRITGLHGSGHFLAGRNRRSHERLRVTPHCKESSQHRNRKGAGFSLDCGVKGFLFYCIPRFHCTILFKIAWYLDESGSRHHIKGLGKLPHGLWQNGETLTGIAFHIVTRWCLYALYDILTT